jgi:hypothetical protein
VIVLLLGQICPEDVVFGGHCLLLIRECCNRVEYSPWWSSRQVPWSVHGRDLQNAVTADAGLTTHDVTRKEGQVILLKDLDHIPMPETPTAGSTDPRLRANHRDG